MDQVLTAIQKRTVTVLEVRNLTESTYVLRFERMGLEFKPGQYVVIGLPGSREKREYSIYSSVGSAFMEVLIKEVDNGEVSKKLKDLKKGEKIEMEGPFGYFVLDGHKINQNKFLFIASGTGISPFHSFVTSYPQLDYKLLHGVRTRNEAYEKFEYEKSNHILCTSRDENGDFHGRVTDYLKKHPVDALTLCYLCGNSEMVDDAYRILESQGVPPAHLHAEIYF
jgi:ferredoxin--NADP+ reductase/benzoate/toluate 1,2-dioxygenase reductase subunit